jgi:hypothetical protein
MSDSKPFPEATWACPDWSRTYAELVAAIAAGEEPIVTDRPFVFAIQSAQPDDLDEPSRPPLAS